MTGSWELAKMFISVEKKNTSFRAWTVQRHDMVNRHFSGIQKVKESESEVPLVRLCDPMDCSLPGSSVHRIFQAKILKRVAISFSRRSSRPRDWTWASHTVGRRFTVWATREAYWRKGPSLILRRLQKTTVLYLQVLIPLYFVDLCQDRTQAYFYLLSESCTISETVGHF